MELGKVPPHDLEAEQAADDDSADPFLMEAIETVIETDWHACHHTVLAGFADFSTIPFILL